MNIQSLSAVDGKGIYNVMVRYCFGGLFILRESCCYRCVNFLPHDIYEYIGFCKFSGGLVLGHRVAEDCSGYGELTMRIVLEALNRGGWVYCVDCRKPIFHVEELEEHVNHRLTLSPYSDSVASEDAPVAE